MGIKLDEFINFMVAVIGEIGSNLDNRFNIRNVEQLVDLIYEHLKYHVNKVDFIESTHINDFSIKINEKYLCVDEFQNLLSKYKDSKKKKIYYVKKSNFSIRKPDLLQMKKLLKEKTISKDGKTYITEEFIKKIIKATIYGSGEFKSYLTKSIEIASYVTVSTGALTGQAVNVFEKLDFEPEFYIIQGQEEIRTIIETSGLTEEEFVYINDIWYKAQNKQFSLETLKPGDTIIVKSSIINNKVDDMQHVYKSDDISIGIDVSYAQKDMDLELVQELNDLDFIIARAFNFAFDNPDKQQDENFKEFVEQVKKIKEKCPDFDFSFYFLPDINPENPEKVKECVDKVGKLIRELREQGIECTFPVYIDIEPFDVGFSLSEFRLLKTYEQYDIPLMIMKDIYSMRLACMTPEELKTFSDEFVQKFYPALYNLKLYVDVIKENGAVPGFYSNKRGYKIFGYDIVCEYLDITEPYKWVADYNGKLENTNKHIKDKKLHDEEYSYGNHQYGIVNIDGYEGKVDGNSTTIDYRKTIENEKNNIKNKEEKKESIDKKIEFIEILRFVMCNLNSNTIEEKSYKLFGKDYHYENGLITLKINDQFIIATCDEDLRSLNGEESMEIVDINTSKKYTLTRVKDDEDFFLLFEGGLVNIINLEPTSLSKDFYESVTKKVIKKLKVNNKELN